MKNTTSNNTKFILLHPSLHKQAGSRRLWLLAMVSFFTFAVLLTLINTKDYITTTTTTSSTSPVSGKNVQTRLPTTVADGLLHYASNSNNTGKMTASELKFISEALRNCPSTPCNFFVFGLTHKFQLWQSLIYDGRTVFLDENEYYIAYLEQKHPDMEAYNVSLPVGTGKDVSDLHSQCSG